MRVPKPPFSATEYASQLAKRIEVFVSITAADEAEKRRMYIVIGRIFAEFSGSGDLAPFLLIPMFDHEGEWMWDEDLDIVLQVWQLLGNNLLDP